MELKLIQFKDRGEQVVQEVIGVDRIKITIAGKLYVIAEAYDSLVLRSDDPLNIKPESSNALFID